MTSSGVAGGARAVLTNMGSVGDVQPLWALAAELRRAGDRPVMALPPYYRERTAALGFEYVSIGPEMDFAEIDRRDVARLLSGEDEAAVLRDALARVEDLLPRMYEELSAACLDADVLIAGHLQPAAQMVHEIHGTPFVSVHVNHFGGSRAPAERAALAGVINPFRARYGLRPLSDPLHGDANSPQLALYAISRHLGLSTSGWPAHQEMVGFFFLDEEGWAPDPALAAFLAEGEPPVAFSFSSMTHGDPGAVTDLLLAAVEQAGCRAVIQHGWSGLARGRRLPESVHATGFVPHAWLFPRCACVVHHGGAQSSAAVLRAGVPAVVVPHIRDQPVWAELVRGTGCARAVVPESELSPGRLGAAVRETLDDPACRRAAESMGRKIRAEGGVVAARRLIHRLLAELGVTAPREREPDEARDVRRERSDRRRDIRRQRRSRRAGAATGTAGGGPYPEASTEGIEH